MREVMVDSMALIPQGGVIVGDMVVIADLHIGYEASDNPSGLAALSLEPVKEKLRTIRENYLPEVLVVAGDVKHSFTKARGREWEAVRDGIRFMSSLFPEVRIIRGNHDNYLINIIKRLKDEGVDNISWYEEWINGELRIFHGHFDFYEDGVWNIMGHEHPALELGDRVGERKIPAFIVDNKRKIVVLPAFSPVMYGVDAREIINGNGLSPLWHEKRNNCTIYATDGKELYPVDHSAAMRILPLS